MDMNHGTEVYFVVSFDIKERLKSVGNKNALSIYCSLRDIEQLCPQFSAKQA
jgi:hypothetical protein